MKTTYLRVRAVEGSTVLDHRTGKTAQHHRVGHRRIVDGEVSSPLSPRPEPRIRYEFHGEPEVVQETNDGYYHRKIVDGDLDYLETLDGPAVELGKGKRDPVLVRATVRNKAAREAAKLLEAKALETQAANEAAALTAAEQGLTVEELYAKQEAADAKALEAAKSVRRRTISDPSP